MSLSHQMLENQSSEGNLTPRKFRSPIMPLPARRIKPTMTYKLSRNPKSLKTHKVWHPKTKPVTLKNRSKSPVTSLKTPY